MSKPSMSVPTLNRRQVMALPVLAGAAGLPIQTAHADALTPKRGGKMVLASRHGYTTDTTDPALYTNAYQSMLGLAFTNTLTEFLPDGSLGPVLAESWDSKDGKTWRFRLRKGVSFHDGRRLNSEDVVASINHHRAEDSNSFMKPIADQFVDVRADGQHAIIVTLAKANANLPALLSNYAFTIYPASGGKMDWKSRNGTGPYILKDHKPGSHAYMDRNPNYFRDDRAFANEVELLSIPDPSRRMEALLSGKVHAIDGVDLKSIAPLKSNPDIIIDAVKSSLHYSFSMRMDTAPFNNVDVRTALKYAIDRDELVEKILYGYGVVGNDTPIGPTYPYWAKTIPQRSYDPDRAKFHLKRAGINDLKVDLWTSEAAFVGATEAALLYADHARRAGIDINVVREPAEGYWENIWLKRPFVAVYWGGFPTEDEMFTIAYSKGAAWNDTRWDNPRFEELRIKAMGEMNADLSRQMYAEMQQILHDDGGVLAFAFPDIVMARSSSIAHGPLSSVNTFDGLRATERWWVVD